MILFSLCKNPIVGVKFGFNRTPLPDLLQVVGLMCYFSSVLPPLTALPLARSRSRQPGPPCSVIFYR